MAKPKIQINDKAVRDLLRGKDMQRVLKRSADAIANRAGPGHEVNVHEHANRARATVVTATREAMEAEATDRNLTSSLDAGRNP